jgi:hypothetical protein
MKLKIPIVRGYCFPNSYFRVKASKIFSETMNFSNYKAWNSKFWGVKGNSFPNDKTLTTWGQNVTNKKLRKIKKMV